MSNLTHAAKTASAILFLSLAIQASGAAVMQPPLTLQAVSNAHYRTHHLLGNAMASPDLLRTKREEIESNLRILEAVELTASIATKYRLSVTRIEEGARHYQQARQATGRKRSELVELGNAAFRAAKALLDVAVKIFNEVAPQLMRFFAAQAEQRGRPKWPVKIKGEFFDCLARESHLGCCDSNYDFGISVIKRLKKKLTADQQAWIKQCLDRNHERCERLFKDNHITFLKEHWEDCFKGFVIFEYPP